MSPIRVIFVGTGAVGDETLEAVAHDVRFEIPLILTGKSKPAGRGLKDKESSIKQIGIKNNLIVQETDNIAGVKQKIIQQKAALILVMAYGEIIPKELFEDTSSHRWINIHPSLLPRYRGATPINETLLHGDLYTGVSWIKMNEGMDSGDIIRQIKLPIQPEDDYKSLSRRLSTLSAQETGDVLLEFYKSGKTRPQDQTQATYCHKIKKEDGLIEPDKEDATKIIQKIKAYAVWPGCFLNLNGKRLKILKAGVADRVLEPGQLHVEGGSLFLGTKNKTLDIKEVQPEGKKPMGAADFLRGQRSLARIKSSL